LFALACCRPAGLLFGHSADAASPNLLSPEFTAKDAEAAKAASAAIIFHFFCDALILGNDSFCSESRVYAALKPPNGGTPNFKMGYH